MEGNRGSGRTGGYFLWPGSRVFLRENASASGGSWVLQIGCAFQHGVWKRHVGGGSRGLATSRSASTGRHGA
jgi:hypothetical protein